MNSSPARRAATHPPEVAARLVAVLDKMPKLPKTRIGIARALAPAVAALIAEAQAAPTATPKDDA